MIQTLLFYCILLSLSARRAWIEIEEAVRLADKLMESLSARRAWIEIVMFSICLSRFGSRSPQGERGLKFSCQFHQVIVLTGSLSARRAWIEMRPTMIKITATVTSLSARRAWIEINFVGKGMGA